MIAVASMNVRTALHEILAALRAIVIDRPFTPGRRAKLGSIREADRAWALMMVQDDDPTTLERLTAIMSDRPITCDNCGGNAYVCRAIGCDPEGTGRTPFHRASLGPA